MRPGLVLLMVVITASICTYSQSARRDAEVIRYARSLPVSRIEPGMPKQRLDTWLRKILGRNLPLKWEVNDCGEQTGTPVDRGRDFPMCVEATAETLDVFFTVSLMVGTFRRGVSGTPQIRGLAIHIEGEGEFEVKRLSNLKGKLRELGVDTN